MRILCLVIALLTGVWHSPARAGERYANKDQIPVYLKKHFHHDQCFEDYLSLALSIIRVHGKDKTVLTKNSIADAIKAYRTNLEQNVRREILAYDANLDLKVTREEVRNDLQSVNNQNGIKDYLENRLFEEYDTNNDDVITREEITLPEESPHFQNYVQRINGDIMEVLELASGEGEKLTASELQNLAEKAFHTIDTDGDGCLSEVETTGFLKPRALPKHVK